MTAPQAIRLGPWLAPSDDLEAARARVRARMAAVLQPDAAHVAPWQRLPGVNREAAEMGRAELGGDMSRFPSAAPLASWAGVCAGPQARAGPRNPGRTRPGHPGLQPVWVAWGWGAGRARRTSLGAHEARLGRRRGTQKAAVAVGPRLLVTASPLLRDGVPSQELGPDPGDRLATHRLTRHEVGRLEPLGDQVPWDPGAPVASYPVRAFWGTSVFNILCG